MNFYTEDNFLTPAETLKIRNDVMDLQHRWHRIDSDPPRQYDGPGGVYTLGDAVYLHNGRGGFDIFDKNLKSELINKFGWIHDKIKSKMEGLTGKRCEYHPFLPCPGFHISSLPFEIYQVLPFHIDSSILHYSRNVDLSHVRSILLLIEQPTEGAGLEYLNAHQTPTLYHYEYEKFHMWSGGLIHHRMTGLKCGEGEHRITLQCHLYYDPILDINIMYF